MLTWHSNRLSDAMSDGVSRFSQNSNLEGVFYQGMHNAACQAIGH